MRDKKEYRRLMLTCIAFFLLIPVFYGVSDAGDQAVIHPGGGKLLNFWAEKENKEHWVGENQSVTLKANYGQVMTTTMTDVQGSIMGGEIDPRSREDNVPLREPVNITVQKRNDRGAWENVPSSFYSLGKMGTGRWGCTFNEQGYYRFVITLEPGVAVAFPRQTPRYSNLYLVKDKKYQRSEGITSIRIMGGSVTVYGNLSKSPNIECGKTHVLTAMIKKGRIDAESDTAMVTVDTPWQRFDDAVWSLKQEGEVVATQTGGLGYNFRADQYGDGSYVIEAALPDNLQGHGIQNFKIKPAQELISVYNCGAGEFWKTPEGQEQQKKIRGEAPIINLMPENVSEVKVKGLDKDNKEVQMQFVNHLEVLETPPKPKDVPVNIMSCERTGNVKDEAKNTAAGKQLKDNKGKPQGMSKEKCMDEACADARKQIKERKRHLDLIPCQEVEKIMTDLMVNDTVNFYEKARGFSVLWNSGIEKIQKAYEPVANVTERYKMFIAEAVSLDLAVKPEVLAQERTQSSKGGAPVIGDGLPVGMVEYNPNKIGLLAVFEKNKREIGEAWVKARDQFNAGRLSLQVELEKLNMELFKLYEGLEKIQANHGASGMALSRMFHSGEYEHCLGSPGEMQYIAGQDLANGLPGMNIKLPVPPKRKYLPLLEDVPRELPFGNLRLKINGVKQQEQDRRVVESMVEEERLKAYYRNGTLMNLLAYTLYGGAVETGVFDDMADTPWYAAPGDMLNHAGRWTEYLGKDVIAPAASAIGTGLYNDVFVRKLWEPSALGKILNAMGQGIQSDLANSLRGAGKAFNLIENELYKNPFEGLGDTPQENARAVAAGMNQLDAITQRNQEIDGLMNSILMLTSLVNPSAPASSSAMQQKLYKQLLEGKKYIDDEVKKLEKYYDGKRIADEVKNLEKTGQHVPDDLRKAAEIFNEQKKAVEASAKELNKTIENNKSVLEEAGKQTQLENKVKEIEKKFDEAIKKQSGPVKGKPLASQDAVIKRFTDENGNAIEVPVSKNKLGHGATSDAYINGVDDNKVVRVTPLNTPEGKLGASLDDVGREAINSTQSNFVRMAGRDKVMYVKDEKGVSCRVEINEKVKSANEWMKEQQGQLNDAQKLALEQAMRDLNAKGYVWLDNHTNNYGLEEINKGVYRVVVFDSGGIYPMKGANLADKAVNARQFQKAMVEKEMEVKRKAELFKNDRDLYAAAYSDTLKQEINELARNMDKGIDYQKVGLQEGRPLSVAAGPGMRPDMKDIYNKPDNVINDKIKQGYYKNTQNADPAVVDYLGRKTDDAASQEALSAKADAAKQEIKNAGNSLTNEEESLLASAMKMIEQEQKGQGVISKGQTEGAILFKESSVWPPKDKLTIEGLLPENKMPWKDPLDTGWEELVDTEGISMNFMDMPYVLVRAA